MAKSNRLKGGGVKKRHFLAKNGTFGVGGGKTAPPRSRKAGFGHPPYPGEPVLAYPPQVPKSRFLAYPP